MGLELTEKDSYYSDFIKTLLPDQGEPVADETPAEDASAAATPQENTSEYLIIACRACGVKNRLNKARLLAGGKCGKCGTILPPE